MKKQISKLRHKIVKKQKKLEQRLKMKKVECEGKEVSVKELREKVEKRKKYLAKLKLKSKVAKLKNKKIIEEKRFLLTIFDKNTEEIVKVVKKFIKKSKKIKKKLKKKLVRVINVEGEAAKKLARY